MKFRFVIYISIIVIALLGCTNTAQSPLQPEGNEKSLKTKVLETGASIFQSASPADSMNIYLVGFHAAKDNPSHQMEAHHFCRQVNEDFAQCSLFDGNTEQANLIGIEYIISEMLFESLPEKEKEYWHPHNFEILSGQLIAPNIPDIAEKELMKGKMNSYGKTWHVWNSAPFGKTGDKLPLGEPVLEWSFNSEGEVMAGLIEQRDQKLNVSTLKKRQNRSDLTSLSNPQSGVDAMKNKFTNPTTPFPGIRDKLSEQ